MKIPFADLFRRSKAKKAAEAQPKVDAPMPTAKKSESERLAKTVMPSTARHVVAETEDSSPSIHLREATAGQASLGDTPPQQASTSTITSRSTNSAIATEIAVPLPPAPRISMGAAPQTPLPNLPPAVALALAPNIERAISLPLEDVIAQMPEGYLKPRASFDVNRPVLLRAAEVEKGMAIGRPSIPVATLFQQAPDIFMHTVPSSDGAMIALPFERVMNALSNLARRRDQAAVQAVPQVDTPFLQATKEDTERFGTPMPMEDEPAEAEESAPVRIEAASAEAYAAATPEAADAFVPAVDPTRIPFTPETEASEALGHEKFGTGEPAFPRVPASSGPPVPPAPAEATAPAAPARIPFNFTPPSGEGLKKAETLKTAVTRVKERPGFQTLKSEVRGQKSEAGESEPVLTLPLRPILQHLPPMQLGGNPAAVSDEATVSFPMSMIAPQLASGKVAVKPNAFYAALPEEYRKLFLPDAVDAPVQLPLADVLAHLPGDALRVREDQEEHTPDEVFETPFSEKAKEDAARFEGKAEKLNTETLRSEAGKSDFGRRKAEESPMAEAAPTFDAKEAVAKACALSGVQSCGVIFSDGLGIAGNIPESMRIDGLSAVAPTLLQKLGKHMLETSLGSLKGMTVHAENAEVSFFAAGDVCLTALHGKEELKADSRRELIRTTEEISRAYSQTVNS